MQGVSGSSPDVPTIFSPINNSMSSEIIEQHSASDEAGQLNEREEYLYRLRHSTAHVLAQAVQELFPEAKKTIGPPIEDGFYYDFDCPQRFTPEDLLKIEERMNKIVKENHKFIMSALDSSEAKKFWAQRGEKYKVELIETFAAPTVTHCTHGPFIDLCRGRHLESTEEIRHFKLLKVAGAYWRGDEKREQLQRIYGTAWPSKKELDEYLHLLDEAKKRDHRELGKSWIYFPCSRSWPAPA
jgi:threonyl-tRNA synthetase